MNFMGFLCLFMALATFGHSNVLAGGLVLVFVVTLIRR